MKPNESLTRRVSPGATLKRFAALMKGLSGTMRVREKAEVISAYFKEVDVQDGVWALGLLLGQPTRRIVSLELMKSVACHEAGIARWLYDECMKAVGDSAETLALIMPEASEARSDVALADWMQRRLPLFEGASYELQSELLRGHWMGLTLDERIVFNKIVAGKFRAGVSLDVLELGLSLAFSLPVLVLRQRLALEWAPSPDFFQSLVSTEFSDVSADVIINENHIEVTVTAQMHSVFAVLMYAERDGDGNFVTYTFGAWSEDVLIPIAKIECDLPERERSEIDSFIRANTLEKIGPIRTVRPEIVVEIGFDAIEIAPRRKAGVLLRGSRAIQWHRDKTPELGVQLQFVKGLTEG